MIYFYLEFGEIQSGNQLKDDDRSKMLGGSYLRLTSGLLICSYP